MYAITKRFTFHAAHTAGCGPTHQPTLHGHTYTLTVRLTAELLAYPGIVTDGATLNRIHRYLSATVDHRNLDEVFDEPADNQTIAEHLRTWCQDQLPLPRRVHLDGLEIHAPAPPTTRHRLAPYEITFEAAHRLPRLSTGHHAGRTHGHSYTVGLVLNQPGPNHAGQALAPLREHIARRLDHRHLNDELPDTPPTSENLARYLFDWSTRHLALPPEHRLTAVRVANSSSTWAEYQPRNASPA